MDHHSGQYNPGWDRPMMSAMTTLVRIWSAALDRAGLAPFISDNRTCEPAFAGVGALATFPNLPGRNDFSFVPALVLAGRSELDLLEGGSHARPAPGMKELYSSGEVRAIPGEDGGAVEYRSEEGVSSPMS
jgi:hypothetical protein